MTAGDRVCVREARWRGEGVCDTADWKRERGSDTGLDEMQLEWDGGRFVIVTSRRCDANKRGDQVRFG